MELSEIGRRGVPQAGRDLGALRSPGQKVNQRLQSKVEGEEYVYILTTPPYQNASGLHSNCSSKSASETAGISRGISVCGSSGGGLPWDLGFMETPPSHLGTHMWGI